MAALPTSTARPPIGDGLIDAATNGHYWQLDGSRTINWSLANGFSGEYWLSPSSAVASLNTAFSKFSYFANVSFNYVGYFSNPSGAYAAGSNITVSLDSTYISASLGNSVWALGFFPATSNNSLYQGAPGDIFLNINSLANSLPSYAPGSAGYALALHEIGHTLGLKHPFDDGGTGHPTLTSLGLAGVDYDWFSVMSYADDYNWNLTTWDPATPMPMDVLALQYLYGPNLQTNSGNSTHVLSANFLYQTIWDASGADLVDALSSSMGWQIILPDIQLSAVVTTKVGGAMPMSEVSLSSPFTLYWLMGDIENASGSQFADEIEGNGLANLLRGNGGNDELLGDGGNDEIDGGAGSDVAAYSGVRTGYQLVRNGSGWEITDVDASNGNDGRDSLTNVERAQFSDGMFDLGNRAPVSAVTSTNRGVHIGQSLGAGSLFNGSDAESDAVTQYRFWDGGAAQSSGYFSLNGVRQGAELEITVAASDLANLSWVAGSETGSEKVWGQASDPYGFGAWASWTMSTTNSAPVVTPTAATQGVPQGLALAVSTLFGTSDVDGDAITAYRFWDGGTGGGQFRVNGVGQIANGEIVVSAANFANTVYVGGASQGSEVLYVQAFDGLLWSPWANWTMQTQRTTNAGTPVISGPGSRNSEAAQWHQLSGFLTVSDADGDRPVRFEIVDTNAGAGTGLIYANGANQAQGAIVTVTVADLTGIWVQGGLGLGTNGFTIRAHDGFDWGAAKSFDLVTRLRNEAPVVIPTGTTQGVGTNQTVAISTLFSVTDVNEDAMTQYKLWDGGAGGGQFRINGVGQIANGEIVVSAANFANTVYAGGTSQGSETVWVQAFDGLLWSPWANWTMQTQRTTNAGTPVINAPATRAAEQGKWYKLSDFVTVTDADGDAPVRFELRDGNAVAGSGYLYANGADQAQGATVTVNAPNLSTSWVRGGQNTGADTIQIRAHDGFDWGAWASFELATRLPNVAPSVVPTAATQTVATGQQIAVAGLFAVNDANGDPATEYRLWDGANGGGFFIKNGAAQPAAQNITVSAAEMANTFYVGAATPGSETLWAQASDGLAYSPWQSWRMDTLAAG